LFANYLIYLYPAVTFSTVDGMSELMHSYEASVAFTRSLHNEIANKKQCFFAISIC